MSKWQRAGKFIQLTTNRPSLENLRSYWPAINSLFFSIDFDIVFEVRHKNSEKNLHYRLGYNILQFNEAILTFMYLFGWLSFRFSQMDNIFCNPFWNVA